MSVRDLITALSVDSPPRDQPTIDRIAPITIRRASFDGLTCSQLFAEPTDRPWLTPGVFSQHEPAVIVGPSKCMKTSISIDLCASLATGRSFLGKFAAARTFRVGVMSGESNRYALTDMVRRWSAGAEVDLSEVDNLVWSLKLPNLTSAASLHDLQAWIREYQLEVVLLDPLYLMAPGVNPANIFAMGAILSRLSRSCLGEGATPILCHHTRKRVDRRPLDLTDMAGAGCAEFARQWLLLNRRRPYQAGSGRHRLWMTIGGAAGQESWWGVDIEEGRGEDSAARHWRTTVRDLPSLERDPETQEQLPLEARLRRKIRAAFEKLGEPAVMKTRVKENSGLNGARFQSAWDAMIKSGEIIETELIQTGKNNQATQNFQLAQT
ncbi:MAG: AAA family ATPase [Blastopirellula sp. JB062]